MYSYGTGPTGQERNGNFHFFTGSHNQIGKFIYDQHYMWQKSVSIV
jgi:hypothetical protein